MESFHPLFEPAVVSVNVLNMIGTSDDSNPGSKIDGAMGDSKTAGHGSINSRTIAAENDIFFQNSA